MKQIWFLFCQRKKDRKKERKKERKKNEENDKSLDWIESDWIGWSGRCHSFPLEALSYNGRISAKPPQLFSNHRSARTTRAPDIIAAARRLLICSLRSIKDFGFRDSLDSFHPHTLARLTKETISSIIHISFDCDSRELSHYFPAGQHGCVSACPVPHTQLFQLTLKKKKKKSSDS